MAEGFEVYHVPQQSRRDKLRVGGTGTSTSTSTSTNTPSSNNNFHIAAGNLLPLYHHPSNSFISSSDLLPPQDFHHPLNQTPSFRQHHLTNNNTCNNPSSLNYPFPDQPLSLELNLQQQRYGSPIFCPDPPPILNNNDYSHSSLLLPLPLPASASASGYHSPILKASKFLKPAQQLLHDLFDDSHKSVPPDSPLLDPLLQTLGADIIIPSTPPADHPTQSPTTKSSLLSMLDQVYRRYKQYYQQMQAVVATFEYIAGLGNAAPYVNLAVKAMFKHFRFLKNAIADQLQFNKQQQQQQQAYNPYCQRSIHNNAGFLDHQPVWRPQRGLPESAVTVLRAWLFEHFLHPYPTDTDKLMLANQTGLSRSQVSNWFINARVRLWKPMVEEIHMLETRQAQKCQQREGHGNGNGLNKDHVSSTNESLKGEQRKANNNNNNACCSSNQEQQAVPVELSNPNNINMFGIGSHHPHAAAGNVSLTLGLHQNQNQNHAAITLSDSINAAHHFNLALEANVNGTEGFVNEWF